MRSRSVLPGLLVLLAGPAALLPAQSLYIYAASAVGRTSANGYPLDNLPDSTSSFDDETWRDLFVDGPDRWLIRGDGRISKNGATVEDLAEDDGWRGLVVDDQGEFFALRNGGRVSGPGGIIIDYTADDFTFLEIITDGQEVYVLRTNGSVFRVSDMVTNAPIIRFDGPQGEIDGADEDGEAADVDWVRLAINPADGRLWGLRRDGRLQSAAIPAGVQVDPVPGDVELSLPYDHGDDFIDVDELYRDFTFDADGSGTWFALRADGKLYNTVTFVNPPLEDFPGEASEDDDQEYEAVLAGGGIPVVLRNDGKVYRDTEEEDETAIIDLKDADYFGLAVSMEFPNLDNVDNKAPTATCMTITAPEGADIELPVLAVDRDKPAADLVVAVDAGTLPAGASFDDVTRVITWPAAGPAGTYKVTITVDDGIAKPVKAVQTFKIQTVDGNAEKNVKPVLAKVKRATALAALPFSLPLPAFDRDGDPVGVSLDDSGKPLPDGVTFDEPTSTLEWNTPAVADKGTWTFHYLVDDGTVVAKVSRKVKVDTSLLAF
jgi:hypothetical protein